MTDETLTTLALEAELLALEHQVATITPQRLEAQRVALDELDDLQQVESGPLAWWLALTGGAEERVAKERAEAEEAVGTSQVLRATALALGARLAEVRELRRGRPDPTPVLAGRAWDDPEVEVLLDRHDRLGRAALAAREAQELLERALAQLAVSVRQAATRNQRNSEPFEHSRVAVCSGNLREAGEALDRMGSALEGTGVAGPARCPELRVDESCASWSLLSDLEADVRRQREELLACVRTLTGPRAEAAAALLEALRPTPGS